MPTRAERVAKVIHDEIVVHQTPGFTPFWEHQPESYHREAVKSDIVIKLLAAMASEDDSVQ